MDGRVPPCRVRGVFKRLDSRLVAVLEKRGICEPTPIQEKAIPLILEGLHTLVVAPTGSGKTETALLPLASRLLRGARREGIRVLYVTPLRSLNRDIFARVTGVLEEVGLRVYVRHGDSTPSERRMLLENPPDVVIMTPESLEYLLSSSERFRSHLENLEAVVVDELHELIDDKRGSELAVVLERLERISRRRVQRIGLSATIGDTSLAAQFLGGGRHVEVVEAPGGKRYVIGVEAPEPSGEDVREAEVYGLEPETLWRLRRIREYVERFGHVLLFTNTRDTAELLGRLLKTLYGEGLLEVHHGSLSRDLRVRVERDFREGRLPLLIATSSLELGIDIGHVNFVIQYLSPRQASKLVQRVGRAGHRLGEESRGVVLTLNNFYDVLESIVLAARAVRGDIEEPRPYEKPLDVLVHEIAGIVDERGEVSIDEVYDIISRAYPFRDLTREEFEEVVELMEHARIVRRVDGKLRPGRRLKTYHYSVTMIPDVKQYPVIEYGTGRKVGVLDEVFVADLKPGKSFVLAGRVWEVVEVGEARVIAKQVGSDSLVLPVWEGDLIPVEWKAAREAGALVRRLVSGDKRVYRKYPGSRRAWEILGEVLERQRRSGAPIPDDKTIVLEAARDIVALLGFFGTRLAKTLEYLVAGLIEEMLGYTPETASNAYLVAARLNSRPSPLLLEGLKRTLSRLTLEEARGIVERVARGSTLYYWKLYHVAVRMGLVEKGAKPERRLLEALSDTLAGREALRELIHDKLDFEALGALLEAVRSGRVRIVTRYSEEPSPLLLEAVGVVSSGDRVKSATIPSSVLAEALKKRLESRRVRLVCIRCGHVFEARLGDLPERPECPRCGSRLLAPTSLEPGEARRLVEVLRRKGLRGLRGEERKARELAEAADLVLSYGKMALYALATRGVGVKTAKKVLGKLAFGEEAFFKELVEAEQRFAKTRRYWG